MSVLTDKLELDNLVVRPDSPESRATWVELIRTPGGAELLREAGSRRRRIDALAAWIVSIPWAAMLVRLVRDGMAGSQSVGPPAQILTGAALAGLGAERQIALEWGETSHLRVTANTEVSVKPPKGAQVVAFAGSGGWDHPVVLGSPYAWRVESQDVPLVLAVVDGSREIRSGADLAGQLTGAVVVDIEAN